MRPDEQDAIRSQFRALITELVGGALTRNTFQPWEIDLIVDIDQYELPPSLRRRLLHRYERAVLRVMARNSAARPFLFSDYLATTWLGKANPYRRASRQPNVM